MINRILILVSIIFCLASCSDKSHQYDVLIKNETGEVLIVNFESESFVKTKKMDTVTISSDNKLQRILSTQNIDNESLETFSKDLFCEKLFNNIEVYKSDGTPSKLDWCNTKQTILTDFGQSEIIITYASEDF